MDCKICREQIDLYIDNELSQDQIKEFEQHIETCQACREEYESSMELKEMLSSLPEIDLPDGFGEELHSKLVEASSTGDEEYSGNENVTKFNIKGFVNKYKYALSSVAAVLVVSVIVTSGGIILDSGNLYGNYGETEAKMSSEQAAEESSPMKFEGSPEMDMAVQPTIATVRTTDDVQVEFDENQEVSKANFTIANETSNYALEEESRDGHAGVGLLKTGNSSADNKMNNSGRKIIHNGNLAIETEDYESVEKLIVDNTLALNGFVMNSNNNIITTYRNGKEIKLNRGYYTLRVPSEYFYTFFEDLGTFGEVISNSTHSNDITQNYRDTVTEVTNLKVQEERLREILKTAETVEDVLNVERELSRVRGNINQLEGQVKNWDRLVSMSTISVEVIEVMNLEDSVKPIDDTVIEKAKKGFIKSINNIIGFGERIFILAISIIPIFGIALVVGLIAYIIYKTIRKRRK